MSLAIVPRSAASLVDAFANSCSPRVFERLVTLLIGWTLAPRRRCVTSMLRLLASMVDGHWCDYHRVLSHARYSLFDLGQILATLVLRLVPPDQTVLLSVDDTVTRHRGPKVYGRCCHRDPVRSSHGVTTLCWGHRWVVLAVVIKPPFAARPWALPVLAALYRNRAWCQAHGRRFKTWPQLARQLAALMLRWFPRRRFYLLGDGGYATRDLACFAHRHRDRLTLVTRFYDDAALNALPKKKARLGRGRGRPPRYGMKLPSPGQTVRRAGGHLAHANVAWYGGARREVRLLSGVGGWQRHSQPLVPLRWVFVRDAQGTHRQEYFMSTDPSMRPEQIVSLYTARWPLETTFQECRAHLGLETPRQRCERSVLRTTPMLLALYSLVVLSYLRLPASKRRTTPQELGAPWWDKAEPTFADVLADVRCELWQGVLSATGYRNAGSAIKPHRLIPPLLRTLTLAA
jgi:DDE superfamily endonuclease